MASEVQQNDTDPLSESATTPAGNDPPRPGRGAAEPEAWVKATDIRPLERGSWRWRIRRALWVFYYSLCWLVFKPFYRYQCENVGAVPPKGSFVMVCNHQSMLDPIIVGLAFPRREFYALARRTLMKHAVVRWILLSLNTIPIDRGESDRMAIKDAIAVLRSGRPLLVFPEGTRNTEGGVKPFKPGMLLLIRKAKVPVVPVAISGADRAWPSERKLPKMFGRIRIRFGEPIPYGSLESDKAQALRQLHDAVSQLHRDMEEGRPV